MIRALLSAKMSATDRLIASQVMHMGLGTPFFPSTDISHAWAVVERMQGLHHCSRPDCNNPQCDMWRDFICLLTHPIPLEHLAAGEVCRRICGATIAALHLSDPEEWIGQEEIK
jgi:hypothetical protein